jgi:hypothetical protein
MQLTYEQRHAICAADLLVWGPENVDGPREPAHEIGQWASKDLPNEDKGGNWEEQDESKEKDARARIGGETTKRKKGEEQTETVNICTGRRDSEGQHIPPPLVLHLPHRVQILYADALHVLRPPAIDPALAVFVGAEWIVGPLVRLHTVRMEGMERNSRRLLHQACVARIHAADLMLPQASNAIDES